MGQSAIDAGAIPTCTYDLDGLDAAASGIAADGTTISTAGTDVNASWQGLSAVYHAPESATLFAAMAPVKAAGDVLGTDLGSVGRILRGFVTEMRPIKARLDSLRTDAQTFRNGIAGNDDWDHDQDTVNRNNSLVHDVNSAVVQMMTAERNCANAIDALFGGTQYHAATSEKDPNGYGVDEIPDDAKTPWGSKVHREDSCPKSALVGTGHFFKGIGTGAWGMVTGLGNLVGIGGWDKFVQSWKGLGELALTLPIMPGMPPIGTYVWGPKEEASRLAALGKGLLGGDHWDDDPAQAAGEAFFNVASLLVPVGGEVSAVGHGAEAAGIAGKAADAAGEAGKLSTAARIAALGKTALRGLLDPVSLIPFDKLPGLGEIAGKIRGTFGFDGSGALTHLDQTLDHLPGGKDFDNLPASPSHLGAGDHEPSVPRTGDGGGSHDGSGAGHDAPNPSREPAHVGSGSGHEGSGSGHEGSGSGSGHEGSGSGSGHEGSGSGSGRDGSGSGSGHEGSGSGSGHDGSGSGSGHDGTGGTRGGHDTPSGSGHHPGDQGTGSTRKPWEPDPAHETVGQHGPVGADGAHPTVGDTPTPVAQALDKLRLTAQQKGALGEALTRDMITRDPDLTLLGEQVPIKVDGHTVHADFLVQDAEGNVFAVDSKYGPNAQFTPAQVPVYTQLDHAPQPVEFVPGRATDQVSGRLDGQLPTEIDGVQVMRWNRTTGSLTPTLEEVTRVAERLRTDPGAVPNATWQALRDALDSTKFDQLLEQFGAGTLTR